jgi:hypothetical protein
MLVVLDIRAAIRAAKSNRAVPAGKWRLGDPG